MRRPEREELYDPAGDYGAANAVNLEPVPQMATLSDRTTELLRESIIAGHYRMGERLAEAAIARQLKISRGPVREALWRLTAEGLVREEPRRGAFVVELTAEDIREIYDLRAAVEGRAARLIIERRDLGALDELKGILDRLRRAAEEGDHGLFNQLDLSFHERLCLLSGNGRLHRVFLNFAGVLGMLFRLEVGRMHLSLGHLLKEHKMLFEAIESLDVARAEEGCNEFMERARAGLIEELGSPLRADTQAADSA
jgi:GntR family transcriptional regulator of gluconate operon